MVLKEIMKTAVWSDDCNTSVNAQSLASLENFTPSTSMRFATDTDFAVEHSFHEYQAHFEFCDIDVEIAEETTGSYNGSGCFAPFRESQLGIFAAIQPLLEPFQYFFFNPSHSVRAELYPFREFPRLFQSCDVLW